MLHYKSAITFISAFAVLAACEPRNISPERLTYLAEQDAAKPVHFYHRGGEVIAARTIAQVMNVRGQCLHITKPIASAEVLVARMLNCVRITDLDAPLFGIHLVRDRNTDVVSVSGSIPIYLDMRALGCLAWYQQQPEYEDNALAYVSWNQLEGECR
jgi:hypothetical protein